MKICSRCKTEKPLSDFGKRSKVKKDGLMYECKECHNSYSSVHTKANRKTANNTYKNWKKKHPEFQLWINAKARAKKKNLPFSIKWKEIVIPEFCPVLGVKLEKSTNRKMQMASPSLDRMVPELGYIPSNIAVISCKANAMKSNGSLEEHKKLVLWLESQQHIRG